MKIGEIWSRKKHIKNESYAAVVIITAIVEKVVKKGMTTIVHFKPYKVKVKAKYVMTGMPADEFVTIYEKDYAYEGG